MIIYNTIDHKGAIAPLYIRESVFTKGYQYGGPQKSYQKRIMGKLKFHLVIVVVVLLQFQLTYLKNCTELRNETLHTGRTP